MVITGYAEARTALTDPRLIKGGPGKLPVDGLHASPGGAAPAGCRGDRNPRDDLLSALFEARDGEDRLSEDELMSMVYLLFIAGHDTTVSLIANGALALLSNPAESRRSRNGLPVSSLGRHPSRWNVSRR